VTRHQSLTNCVRCGRSAEGGRKWSVPRYAIGRFFEVWLCAECAAARNDRCSACGERPALASVPLCVECLMDGTTPRRAAG